ncbi:MAG: addiction module protein [Chloroflexaceae bacterium]|nr:addiction module protein [Chloroflexaceae bacterium]
MTTIEIPTIEQVEALAARLSPQARAELIARLARDLAVIVPEVVVTDEMQAAIDEALEGYRRNPHDVVPHEQVVQQLKALVGQ